MRSWKFLLPLLATSLCFAAQPDRITGPIDSSQMVPLSGHVHPLAKPQFDQGPVEDSLQFGYVTLVMAPSPSQQLALDQLLAQQQDRSSPNYHKWLTPEQYADRFGLSKNDASKITSWLESEGLTVVRVARGRNSVVFSGTAGQVQSALKTQIHRYEMNGEKHIANSTPPSVPAVLAGIVTGVRGLTDFRPKPMYVRPALGGKAGPHPRYTTTVDGSTDYFLAPGDISTIYDINPLYNASTPIDGTGQKLAIMGQTDIYLADLVNFRSGFGLPPFTCTTGSTGLVTSCNTTNFSYVLLGTDPGSPSLGDLFEADLDVEWSGAIARNAQIIFINAETNNGVNDALSYAIDNTTAPVISMSYGECEFYAGTMETELKQGNTEGITILNSEGDTGSAECDYSPPGTSNSGVFPPAPYTPAEGGLAVSYPASSPEVTGVGGTSIPSTDYTSTYWGSSNAANGGSALATLIGQETAWNDDEALAQFCVEDPSNAFCDPSPGVKVTSAQTYQQDYWISIGGSGVSNCFNPTAASICSSGFPKPSWQNAITIPNLTSPQSTYRFVPDVSLLASPNFPGYILCTPVEELSTVSPYDNETSSSCASGIAAAADGVFSGNNVIVDPSIVGGTSASTPVFAGIIALINQSLGTGGLGNINPTLYTLAATPANGVFHPITTGDDNVYCTSNTPAGNPSDVICPSSGVFGFSAANFDPTTKYNLVNGLGSVDANVLAVAWKASLDPDFQLSAGALSPSSIPAGASTTATLTISAIAGSTGAVVNFSPDSCSGLPSGATCSFSPASVNFDGTDPVTTQVTISTLANMTVPSTAQRITIVPTNSPTTTTSVMLTVSATNQSFTIASNANTYSVVPGGTAAVQLTVTGTNGFSPAILPVTYICAQNSLPTEVQCTFSPSNGDAVVLTTPTLDIVTTGPTSRMQPPLGHGRRLYYALLLPGLFGIVFASGSRSRGARLLGLIVILGVSSLGVSSCGGSSGGVQKNTGTPAGTYAIVVNATTAGPNPLTASVTVNLTVQ
jgi:subtilase family serine protease